MWRIWNPVNKFLSQNFLGVACSLSWIVNKADPSRSFSNLSVTSPTSQLILQPFLRHSSFSNPSVASPTSQFILQPLSLLSYVTSSSLTSPGEPLMTCNLMITIESANFQ